MSESSEFECATVLTFEDDTVEWKEVCEFEDGAVGIEVHTGRFTVDGAEVSWVWGSSSCEDPDPEGSARMEVVGETLRLVTPSGVMVFDQVASGAGGGGAAVFGCYDEDGEFEERDIAKL